jgi:hypothetical protein
MTDTSVPFHKDEFVEAQKAALCGQHALNNVYGFAKFVSDPSKKTADTIDLSSFCSDTKDGCENGQWFSNEVLRKAVESTGYVVYEDTVEGSGANVDKSQLYKRLQQYYKDPAYVGSVINVGIKEGKGIHWTALKKANKTCKDGLYIDSFNTKTGSCVQSAQFQKFLEGKGAIGFLHIFSKTPALPNPIALTGVADKSTIDKARKYNALRQTYSSYKSVLNASKKQEALQAFQKEVKGLTKEEQDYIQGYKSKESIDKEMVERIQKIMREPVPDGATQSIASDPGSVTSEPVKPEAQEAQEAQEAPEGSDAKSQVNEKDKKPLYTSITIAGTSILLPTSYEDESRRTAIFAANIPIFDQLKPAEKQVLEMFGMDDAFLIQHSQHMSEFFKSLPSCTTDTSLMLNQRCEKAYYLMWSLMYRQKQFQKTDAVSPQTQAMTQSLVDGISKLHEDNKMSTPVELVSSPGTKESMKDLTTLFFTLLSEEDLAYYQIATL